jgi:hypothetical protein
MIAGAEKYGLDLYPIHFFNAVPRGPINTRGFNTMVDRILQGSSATLANVGAVFAARSASPTF